MYFIEQHKWTGIVYITILHNCDNLNVSQTGKPTNVVEVLADNVALTAITLPWLVDAQRASVTNIGNNTWTIRLPTAEKIVSAYKSSNHIMETMRPKWMRRDLFRQTFRFKCGKCSASLLDSKDCQRINDLPSEFWAEFMDYWHCHKPAADTQSFDKLKYATSLIPAEGEIVLGDSFIYYNKHWNAIAANLDEKTKLANCRQCGKLLGTLTKDGAVKLKKWELESEINGVDSKFTLSDYVLYQILNELKSNSTRFYIIKNRQQIMKLWIFGVGSTIIMDGVETMKNCLKILYRGNDENAVFTGQSNVETITIEEAAAFQDLKNRLDVLNGKLPEQIGKIEDWKVSYLSCE